jgi:hypothetical protein
MLLAASIILRETPRWLYRVDQPTEALCNLSWMRNLPANHPYVQEEYSAIKMQLERERQNGDGVGLRGNLKELGKPGIRNRLGAGMVIMMCQNLSGEQYGGLMQE